MIDVNTACIDIEVGQALLQSMGSRMFTQYQMAMQTDLGRVETFIVFADSL